MVELRQKSAIQLLDTSVELIRTRGFDSAARGWIGALPLALVSVSLFEMERVEGVHAFRPVFAFALVLAWLFRVRVASALAADCAFALLPDVKQSASSPSVMDTVNAACVVAVTLSLWMLLPAVGSVAGAFGIAAVTPLLAFRGAFAPSWLARHGVTGESGRELFQNAHQDTTQRRGAGILAELIAIFATGGMVINLTAAVTLTLMLVRNFFGLDLATTESFATPSNSFFLLVVVACALVVVEPLRISMSAIHYVEARARLDGVDLARAVRAVTRAAVAKKSAPIISVIMLVLATFTSTAQAHDFAPSQAREQHVSDAAREILSAPAYREFADGRNETVAAWLDQLVEALEAWLHANDAKSKTPDMKLPSGLPSGRGFLIGAAVFLLLVLAALAWNMRAPPSSMTDADASAPTPSPLAKAPEVFLDDASVYAGRGDYRAALRALYLATLVALDRQRLLQFDPHRTNGHYLRHMPRSEIRTLFSEFTRSFDARWYGDIPATAEDYEMCRDLAQRICAPELGS